METKELYWIEQNTRIMDRDSGKEEVGEMDIQYS